MSLTGHIKLGPGEPVFDWFAENFPNTREMATEVNRKLRDGPATKPCAVPVPAGSDASLVGTAVGYVLSASLRDDAITSTVATTGARLLDRPLRNLKPLPSAIERQIVSRVEELAPSRRELVGDEWYELLRLVSVLARFEQVRRAGAHVVPTQALARQLVRESGPGQAFQRQPGARLALNQQRKIDQGESFGRLPGGSS
jgi:hypothetical protein